VGSDKVYFFFISGSKKGKIEAASPANGVIRIGRQPYCEVQLDPYEDIPASGNHARVVREGMGWALVDSGSSWGTWKNDQRVSGPVPLTTGDVITLGQDDRGRQGPQIRFYLDRDILRCPGCEGPVYKRHFKCPSCKHKFCLRCIDFRTKTCKLCASRPSGGMGDQWDVVPDSTPAQTPMHVGFPPGPGGMGTFPPGGTHALSPPPAPPAPPFPPRAPGTKVMRAGGGAGAFCRVCCDFVDAPIFTCTSCQQTACITHRHGALCPPCAGMASGVGDREVGRLSEPQLKIPDLMSPGQEGPRPPRPPSSGQMPLADDYPSGMIPPTERLPKQDEEGFPATGSFTRPSIPGTHSDGKEDPYFGDKIEARRPPRVLCERCKKPLSSRDFFVCDRCHQRLCPSHQGDGDTCTDCVSTPASQKLPQDLIETAGDEAGLTAPPLSDLMASDDPDDPLSGVQFECPYCDSPIERSATRCPSCRRDL
jgi:hypothetical protein